MAKKLTDLKNPLTSSNLNLLSPGDWLGSVLYVAWLGLIVSLGIKALMKADSVIPGNNTPAGYRAAVTEVSTNGIQVL